MMATAPGSLPWDLVPNRQMLNRISKCPKSNHISNRSDENRILNGHIEFREVIQSRFKSNRDWDLPITAWHITCISTANCRKVINCQKQPGFLALYVFGLF